MKQVSIKMMADRVLIEPEPILEKDLNGLILPILAQDPPQKGVVVSIGSGKKDEPMTVKVSDYVLYGKHSGTEIFLGEDRYLIMRESDILAIL